MFIEDYDFKKEQITEDHTIEHIDELKEELSILKRRLVELEKELEKATLHDGLSRL